MFQSFGPNPPTFAATLRPHGRMLLSLTQAEPIRNSFFNIKQNKFNFELHSWVHCTL
jgi:hypothetical protein